MVEILQNFERTAADIKSVVLVVPGIAAFVIGVFIWLGGAGLTRMLFAAVGAVTGFGLGYFVIGKSLVAAVAIAGFCSIAALLFVKIFITILLTKIALIAGLAVFAAIYSPEYSPDQPEPTLAPASPFIEHIPIETAKDSARAIRDFVIDFFKAVAAAAPKFPLESWLILAGAAVICILAGSFLWRLAAALCCSTLGTTLIFAGLIMLLLYKQTAPFTAMMQRPWSYSILFLAMTGFGTAEQMIVLGRDKDKPKTQKDSE